MVKAHELRKGNWLRDELGYFQVETFDDHTIGRWKIRQQTQREGDWTDRTFPILLSKCEPIPLTPELLEQCGFKKNPEHHFFQVTKDRLTLNIGSTDGNIILDSSTSEFVTNIVITNLHTLQNLYFALTGEDLHMDLKP